MIATLGGAHRCHHPRSGTRWTCCSLDGDAPDLAQGAPDFHRMLKRMAHAAAAMHGCVADAAAGATMEEACAVAQRTAVEAVVHAMELPRVSWCRV